MTMNKKYRFNGCNGFKLKLLLVHVVTLFVVISLRAQKADVFSDKYILKAMKKATYWQLEHPKHELNEWHNGAFYAGVFSAYQTTESKRIYKAIYDMGESVRWQPGKLWYDADSHVIGQTYIDMYRLSKEGKMIRPIIDTMKVFMGRPFPSRGIKRIPWWWCDALFMAPPLLVKLGITLNEEKYLKLNDQLYRQAYDLLYDQDEKLFARDLRYVWSDTGEDLKESNGKKIFWSRGNGWVMGGLVRILEELPDTYPERDFYIKLFKEMSQKIAIIQQPDGLWRASLLDPEAYPGGEASGSGFFTYAMAWGINKGILSREKYLTTVKNAWKALCRLQHKDGMIGWVQPVGADPRKDFSKDSWEVYGTGAFLLAGSEVIRLFN